MHETAYRNLMRLHVLNGDRARALRIYQECSTILRQEMDTEPSLETQALYESLLMAEAKTTPQQVGVHHIEERTALIGRTDEWQVLLAAWHTANRGQTQIVLISGEAGIGKTRLAEELLVWASQQGYLTARTRAYAMEGTLAYGPITTLLRNEELATRWSKLPSLWLEELVRLLPEVRETQPDLPPPQAMTESWQRQRFFEALARAVLASSEPRIILLDDVQWCDRETLEWIHYLVRFAAQARLLILCTVRSEAITVDHPLTTLRLNMQREGQLVEVALESLKAEETGLLAIQTAGRKLSASETSEIYRMTEGNPLFVVETVRAWMAAKAQHWTANEEGSQPPQLADQSTPPKIYAIIQSRLVQLSPVARGLVQVAAAIGRSFTYQLLVHASDHSEDEVARSLDELWQGRIIHSQTTNSYDFSHDRIREVAYAQISPILRPTMHRRIAQALENLFAANLDSVSPQLAVHYEKAGIPANAVHYYYRGAIAAQRLYAHREAIEYLSKGIDLLGSLADTVEHRQLEIDMQLAIGSGWMFVKGWWTAPEIANAYSRALKLIQVEEFSSRHFLALWGLHQIHLARAELDRAREFAEQLLIVGQGLQEAVSPAIAHYLVGLNLLLHGEFVQAQEHFEQCIAPSVPLERDFHTINIRQVPAVVARSAIAQNLWYLGYPDRALEFGKQAVTFAQELHHPLELSAMLADQAMLHQLRREPKPAREFAVEAIELCTKHNIPSYLARATIILGWALMAEGDVKEGFSLIDEGTTALWEMGYKVREPYYLGLLAEGRSKLGDFSHGLEIIDEALSVAEQTRQRHHLAALVQLKGILLLKGNAPRNKIEDCFSQSLEIARRQQAKSLELRTAISLARLWQDHGRQIQAKELLGQIYSWFQEGLETADLIEAKMLLAQLTSR